MPDTQNPTIWQVETTAGNTYDIEDRQARTDIKSLQSTKHYIGTTTDAIEDGGDVGEITVVYNGASDTVTPVAGQYVIYGAGEYLAADDGKWHKFGDHSGLGALATKDEVTSEAYKPDGTVTLPDLKAEELTSTGTVSIPTGVVKQPAFTGTEDQDVSVSGTPKASVSISAAAVPEGGTATYTPDGNVTITPTDATIKEVADVGTPAELTTTVENGVLKFNFTPNTVPTTKDTTVLASVSAGFEGTGTLLNAKYTGEDTTFTGKFTAEGTVDPITFATEDKTVTVTGTPSVNYDGKAGFEGTETTITSR